MNNDQLINNANNGVQTQAMMEAVPCEVLPMGTSQQVRNIDMVLTINVNEIVKTTMDGVINIVQMMNGSAGDNTAINSERERSMQHVHGKSEAVMQPVFTGQGFIGVYASGAYGVFNNKNRLEKALQFVSEPIMAEFPSRGQAVIFAQQGVASIMGVNVSDIPPMMHPVNWLQRI